MTSDRLSATYSSKIIVGFKLPDFSVGADWGSLAIAARAQASNTMIGRSANSTDASKFAITHSRFAYAKLKRPFA